LELNNNHSLAHSLKVLKKDEDKWHIVLGYRIHIAMDLNVDFYDV